MDCSRHALIGLFGHCPEAKTHFTVSNPKHGFNFMFYSHSIYLVTKLSDHLVSLYLSFQYILQLQLHVHHHSLISLSKNQINYKDLSNLFLHKNCTIS